MTQEIPDRAIQLKKDVEFTRKMMLKAQSAEINSLIEWLSETKRITKLGADKISKFGGMQGPAEFPNPIESDCGELLKEILFDGLRYELASLEAEFAALGTEGEGT